MWGYPGVLGCEPCAHRLLTQCGTGNASLMPRRSAFANRLPPFDCVCYTPPIVKQRPCRFDHNAGRFEDNSSQQPAWSGQPVLGNLRLYFAITADTSPPSALEHEADCCLGSTTQSRRGPRVSQSRGFSAFLHVLGVSAFSLHSAAVAVPSRWATSIPIRLCWAASGTRHAARFDTSRRPRRCRP